MIRYFENTKLLTVAFLVIFIGCAQPEADDVLIGYVEGEYIYIAPPQSGWIVSMLVKEGDLVTAGDLLFELDKDQELLQFAEAQSRVDQAGAEARNISTGARPEEIAELRARLEEANAQLALAEANYERLIPLVNKGLVAKSEGDVLIAERTRAAALVEAVKRAVDVAELSGREDAQAAARALSSSLDAALQQVEWRMEQRTISTRVDGRVEFIFHRQGEFVSTGSPVLAVLPPNALKVRFFVPQGELIGIQPGSTVSVIADGMSEAVDALVSFVATEAEFTPPVIYSAESRDKLVFMVEARLPVLAQLRPGLPVEVRLP